MLGPKGEQHRVPRLECQYTNSPKHKKTKTIKLPLNRIKTHIPCHPPRMVFDQGPLFRTGTRTSSAARTYICSVYTPAVPEF